MRRLLLILAFVCLAAPVRAATTSIDLIKHLTGGHDAVAVRLQLYLSMPTMPHLRPVLLSASGEIPYQRFEGMVRFRADELPIFHGPIRLGRDAEQWPHGELHGIPETYAEVKWHGGREFTLEGLNLRGLVFVDDTEEPYITLTARDLHLTTGIIEVAGEEYRGGIDLEEQQVILVGTTKMPATGKAKIDEVIAGQPVLIYLTASPQEIE